MVERPAQHLGDSAVRQHLDADIEGGCKQQRLQRRDLTQGPCQVDRAFRLRALADQDDIESTGFGTACRYGISRKLKPDRLVPQRRQFLFIAQ